MRLRRLLRPAVLALAVGSAGCGKSAEQKELERQRDALVNQRQVLQVYQSTLQANAAQVIAQNPPDAATQLNSLFQQRTLVDTQLSLVNSQLTDIQYRLGQIENSSYQ